MFYFKVNGWVNTVNMAEKSIMFVFSDIKVDSKFSTQCKFKTDLIGLPTAAVECLPCD